MVRSRPKALPHNRRGDLEPDPATADSVSVGVVIPVFERVALLERTLAGLSNQTQDPMVVVVADDGSTEDVGAAVARWSTQLPLVSVRQERRGYGAGRARNLGAAQIEGADTLLFLDADCVPHPDLVKAHAAWHAASSHLVTVGIREHVELRNVQPEAISSGELDLTAGAGGWLQDFRRKLGRRTHDLEYGDEAFRSFVSSNVAVDASLFHTVGGFSEDFSRWGGEDTELGWRLWQEGAIFVIADKAIIYHQLDEDRSGGREGRDQSRSQNDGTIVTKIPHPFYRQSRRDITYEVPRVSVIVHELPDDLEDIWHQLAAQTWRDFEIILMGTGPQHGPFSELLAADPSVTLVATLEEAAAVARGELVVLLDARLRLSRRLIANLVKPWERIPGTSSLTIGYAVPGMDTYFLHQPDTGVLDEIWRDDGLPLVGAVRRRDLAKMDMPFTERWRTISGWDEPHHVPQPLAVVPDTTPDGRSATDLDPPPPHPPPPPPPGIKESILSNPTAVPGLIRERFRDEPPPSEEPPPPTPPEIPDPRPLPTTPPKGTPGIRYVGWTGQDNLGDELMLEVVADLMPWGEVTTEGSPSHLLLLGGGTLINRHRYLGWLIDRDSPRVERAVFGTGVGNPEYWGETESPERWIDWLSTCAYVGVRGPISVQILRRWGYEGQLEQVGDSALALSPPQGVSPDDSVVVIPAWTNGDLWGNDDEVVVAALADTVAAMMADGRHVSLLTFNPIDDRLAIEISRRAGYPDLPYLAGYRDPEMAQEVIARAGLVVSERLHGIVVAAAFARPFIGLEYRPKLVDFAASVGADSAVLRTDDLDAEAILALVDKVTSREMIESVAARVTTHRRRLVGAAEQIRAEVMG
ncbi:MAG: glycosyltransferase [Acidimicrobiia bacterium]|nr:glycosyltransferase [Acidimicrobiia bacterium]